ncbi:putative transcription regulator SWI/SNF-BAF60b family [Dioscorea sansibarensis]
MSSSRVLGARGVLMAAAKAETAVKGTVGVKPKGSGIVKPVPMSPAAVKAADGRRTNYSGILKPLAVSPAMRDFLGVPEVSRPDALKKIWEHIKLHQLQNPANKREILCDEMLKSIFDGRDKVGMLEIAKLVFSHFQKSK